jgi:hypothetical protein
MGERENLLVGSALAFLLIATGAIAGEEQKSSPWLDDYGQALKAARQSGRPIFVVFRCQH